MERTWKNGYAVGLTLGIPVYVNVAIAQVYPCYEHKEFLPVTSNSAYVYEHKEFLPVTSNSAYVYEHKEFLPVTSNSAYKFSDKQIDYTKKNNL